MKRFNRTGAVLLLLACSLTFGCPSTSSQPSNSRISPITESNPPSYINDDDWEFKFVTKLPDSKKQKRIRCTKEKLCWIWDSQTVWVAERDGNWRTFYSLTPKDNTGPYWIRSVQLVSPKIGWLIRENMLFNTVDGGKSWRNIPIPGIGGVNKGHAFSLFFESENHGWVAGGRYEPRRPNESGPNYALLDHDRILVSCILETTDGGLTWSNSAVPSKHGPSRPVGGFQEIYFWNDEIGFASDQYNCLFTNNGGKSWDQIARFVKTSKTDPVGVETEFVSAFFLDSNRGWALFARMEFEVLATKNRGRSWRHARWQFASDSNDDSSYPPDPSFIFVDDRHGLFVYNHTGGGELFKTSDAGRTWRKIPADASNQQTFYDIFYHATSGGLLIGDRGIYSFSLK